LFGDRDLRIGNVETGYEPVFFLAELKAPRSERGGARG
jgi:hypothetical protein